MNGYIYVMFNPAFPHLIKVGRTTRTSSERAEELFSTGIPGKFIVAYDVLVDDCVEIERLIHGQLSDSRYSQNREFFEASLSEVIKCVQACTRDREIFEIKNASPDDDVYYYLYCVYISLYGGQLYRVGLTTTVDEIDADHLTSNLREKLYRPLLDYYNKIGNLNLTYFYFDLMHAEPFGALPAACKGDLEATISPSFEKIFSKGYLQAYPKIYDDQTIQAKGAVHSRVRAVLPIFSRGVSDLFDVLSEKYEDERCKADEERRRLLISKSRGNF